MDNAGWHAQRRAAYARVNWRPLISFKFCLLIDSKQDQYLYDPPHRGPDGFYGPEHVLPLPEESIGGLHMHASKKYADSTPPLPIRLSNLTSLTAVQRSEALRQARMQPYLQFMVGPLLRYDTVDGNKVWHGAVLIVSTCHAYVPSSFPWFDVLSAADSGSIYDPPPTLSYKWETDPKQGDSMSKSFGSQSVTTFSLGPHPADPYSTIPPTEDGLIPNDALHHNGVDTKSETAVGQELWVYCSIGGYDTSLNFKDST
jgi:hypothetical protein